MAGGDQNAASDAEEETIEKDLVVTKYKMAGDMINKILAEVLAKCTKGQSVHELCEFGDARIVEETGKVYKKEKEMKKGIAFPTCISVNNCVCHFSPLKSDSDVILEDDNVVKVDLGCHVDGFIAVVAHTIVVGATSGTKVTGRKADAILAAHYASQAALRLVKAENTNNSVTDMIQKCAESFKCKPVEGMLSHQLKQNIIDGEKAIIQNPNEAQRKEHEKCEFDKHEVYAIDVLVSTGEGKGREQDARTTVFKKTDVVYQLKMKASRAFLSEVDKKFHNMPFSLRAFNDDNLKKAKMGVIECERHKLLEPFNVLYEREGEVVAQFKFVMLLMPNGPMRITNGNFDPNLYKSEYSIEDEDIKKVLSASANRSKAKKKKKKPVAAVGGIGDNAAHTENCEPANSEVSMLSES